MLREKLHQCNSVAEENRSRQWRMMADDFGILSYVGSLKSSRPDTYMTLKTVKL
ncbi:hypothetical protein EAI_15630 [Harpegnathos saltator]|uniref:Uncharacterized protein n=1 Tax=Harpegnathos saltator TaxID=610380 RepID=E2B2U4_HARSA|nr:hypothetical protein EAI_15630 [Harpegnathos saltator]